MPINVTWGNKEKTYTLFEMSGNWTWEEYYQARSAGVEMVKSVSNTVNIVVDISKSRILPSNVLTNFRSSVQKAPRPFDLCIVVTTSSLIIALINVMNKLRLPIKIVSATTLGEAYTLMQKHDAKLSV